MSFDEIMGGIVPKDDKDYIGKSLIDIYELDEAKIMTRVERLIDMSESEFRDDEFIDEINDAGDKTESAVAGYLYFKAVLHRMLDGQEEFSSLMEMMSEAIQEMPDEFQQLYAETLMKKIMDNDPEAFDDMDEQ